MFVRTERAHASAVPKALKMAVLLSLSTSLASAAETDIAPLFAGYEAGCRLDGTPADALIKWANPDVSGQLPPAGELPQSWRSLAGEPQVSDEVDHWFVTIPLRGASFQGLPVQRFERWYGKSNGISGWALVFAVPAETTRGRIDEASFALDENGNFQPELFGEESGDISSLVCDVSM